MATYRIVFEDAGWKNLLPLVYWRSVGELRCGRRLLLERQFDPFAPPAGAEPQAEACGRTADSWEPATSRSRLDALWVRPELAAVTAERWPGLAVNSSLRDCRDDDSVLLINARWLAEADALPVGSRLNGVSPAAGICQGQLAYLRLTGRQARELDAARLLEVEALLVDRWLARLAIQSADQPGGVMINYPWDLVANNVRQMLADWEWESRTSGAGDRVALAACPPVSGPEDGPAHKGAKVYPGVYLLDEKNIRIGPGSTVKPCTVLDAEEGPIWIGENVRISPHCTIQGPVVIGDGTLIQPGAVIREGTTIGPVCKVGGEIEGSIIWGYSNKQHDGFLGHAVLGSWINIAADSINSDLKNTYGPIRVPVNGVEVDSGRMFVGLTMGDHSKSSINSSFATGTVVGFCSNVICNAFPPKFVPSFCWMTDNGGGPRGRQYDPARGLAVARTVMARRKMTMTAAEQALFLAIAAQCRQLETSGELAPAEA